MKKVKLSLGLLFVAFLTMNILVKTTSENTAILSLEALSASANGFAECTSGVGHCCCGSWWDDTCYCDGTVFSYANMCIC